MKPHVLLGLFAGLVSVGFFGCSGSSIRSFGPPAGVQPTLSPYSVTTTIPVPAGSAPLTVVLPTPPSGDVGLSGTVVFPAPAAPYPAGTVLTVTVNSGTLQSLLSSARRPVASSGRRAPMGAGQGTTVTVGGTGTKVVFSSSQPVTYTTPPTVTVTDPTNFCSGGCQIGFGPPFYWFYTGSDTTAYSTVGGTSGLPGTVAANQPVGFFIDPGKFSSFFPFFFTSSLTVGVGQSTVLSSNSVSASGSNYVEFYPVNLSPTCAIASFSDVPDQGQGQGFFGVAFDILTITGKSVGSCTVFVSDNLIFDTSVLNITVSAPPQVTAVPSALSVTLVTSPTETTMVGQSGYTGNFTLDAKSGCANFASVAIGATSIASNSAAVTVTGTAAGSCTLVIDGGSGQSVNIPVTVNPAPVVPVTVGASSLSMTLGTAPTATTTVMQSAYTGNFTLDANSGCANFANASFGTTNNGSATVTVTGTAAGSCTLVIDGGGGQSASIAITVKPAPAVTASVSSLALAGTGTANQQVFTVTQSGFSGSFTIGTSSTCTNIATGTVGATSGGSATITVVGQNSGGSCNLVLVGAGNQFVTVPITVSVTTVTGS